MAPLAPPVYAYKVGAQGQEIVSIVIGLKS